MGAGVLVRATHVGHHTVELVIRAHGFNVLKDVEGHTCDCFMFCSACCLGAEGVLACGFDEVGSRVLLGFDTGRAGLPVNAGRLVDGW